jgi:branched-chain amino acid transport system ATP-binding protein
MAEPLLEVQGLVKRFGGFTALNKVSLSVKPGERFGLIGPNGSGKTTLINCVSGALPVDGGSIRFGAATSPRCRRTSGRDWESCGASRSPSPLPA